MLGGVGGCLGCVLCQKRLSLSWEVDECKPLPPTGSTSPVPGTSPPASRTGNAMLATSQDVVKSRCRIWY